MNISETTDLLKEASQQMVIGFLQFAELTERAEQIKALQDASVGLREMQLATDELIKRMSDP